jgi:hypothetical protein
VKHETAGHRDEHVALDDDDALSEHVAEPSYRVDGALQASMGFAFHAEDYSDLDAKIVAIA